MTGDSSSPLANSTRKLPTVILMVGMAGSGKSTLMQRLISHMLSENKRVYSVNLDPAAAHVNYPVNIDIRDTVDYKEVMKQYNLGPNGGILTALNLFTTKFGQVLDIVDGRVEKDELDFVLIDTPGQIEIFTWSASGSIITESIASTYPTVVVYVVDTARTTSPTTFMSNMLYSCSILYKTRLPFIVAFNKTDVVQFDYAKSWMTDFEAFQNALENKTTYMSSLIRSMGLVLEEFYEHLRTVGCSALTGDGMSDLCLSIADGTTEYFNDYLPEVQERAKRLMQEKQQAQAQNLDLFMKDLRFEETNQ